MVHVEKNSLYRVCVDFSHDVILCGFILTFDVTKVDLLIVLLNATCVMFIIKCEL